MVPTTDITSALAVLEERYGAPVLAYAAAVTSEALPLVYEAVQELGRRDHLYLLLATAGGTPTAARQLAVLLREHADRLSVVVPARAWSAGTLVCLAADELVLGPMAELGPIDAQVGEAHGVAPDLPASIGSEDVRAFRAMARDWFGVEREEDCLQVLALVAQRIFPTSLAAFYRLDRLVRRIADELLTLRADAPDPERRAAIVDALVSGRDAHDDVILRRDVSALGLPVRLPDAGEAAELWQAWVCCDTARHQGEAAYGLIATRTWVGRERPRSAEYDVEPRHETAWTVS